MHVHTYCVETSGAAAISQATFGQKQLQDAAEDVRGSTQMDYRLVSQLTLSTFMPLVGPPFAAETGVVTGSV